MNSSILDARKLVILILLILDLFSMGDNTTTEAHSFMLLNANRQAKLSATVV